MKLEGEIWSRDRLRHVTPKGQGHDPKIYEAQYLGTRARQRAGYNGLESCTGTTFVPVLTPFPWFLSPSHPIRDTLVKNHSLCHKPTSNLHYEYKHITHTGRHNTKKASAILGIGVTLTFDLAFG